ncbi:glycosyltransferase family 2 protein [Roseateles depolymerans]|nr:glycosyltransferase family 2 protein [Roseateles depolymerans]
MISQASPALAPMGRISAADAATSPASTGTSASASAGGRDRTSAPAAALTRPWLSILIPVYNVQAFLRECLMSVVSQVDESVEIVMLDDRSTDGSTDLMRQLAAEFSSPTVRIHTQFHAENQGISVVRNGLLDAARGDYLWFLDSDDCLLPGAVEGLRKLVRREQPELVLCDYSVLRQAPRLKHRLRGEGHRRTFSGPARQPIADPCVLLRGLFEAGQLHCWSKIAKRSVWEGLRFPAGRYFEDVTLAAPLLLRAASVWYEPQVWVAYRKWEGSILATPSLVKAQHLSEALLDLPAQVDVQALDERARFAWSHFLACHFIGTARTACSAQPDNPGETIAQYKAAFLKSCPMPLADLYAAYIGRAWFVRALRLRRWLKLAAPQPARI